MAYHHAVNPQSAEQKMIIEASVEKYRAYGWEVFSTRAEAMARAEELKIPKWVALHNRIDVVQIPGVHVSRYEAVRKADLEATGDPNARYSIHATEAEARAALPPACYLVDTFEARCNRISVVQSERLVAADANRYVIYQSEDAARDAAAACMKWYADTHTGDVRSRSLAEISGSPSTRRWRGPFETKKEAIAALPVRWTWDGTTRKYRRWQYGRGDTYQWLNTYRLLREILRRKEIGRYIIVNNTEVNVLNFINTLCGNLLRRRRLGRAARLGVLRDIESRLNRLAGRGRIFNLCKDCGDKICIAGVNTYEIIGTSFDAFLVCSDCRSHYRSCEECGSRFTRDLIHLQDGIWLCEDHYDPNIDDDDVSVPGRLMAYSSDVTQTLVPFRKTDREKTCPLWLGYELEVHPSETTELTDSIRAVQKEGSGHIICKSDGSLEGGYEIVSVPASLAWHRENTEPFLKRVNGFIEGWKHPDCGMHVHVGKKEITELVQGKLTVFMHADENQTFISHIAGRSPCTYSRRGGSKKIPDYRREAEFGRYQALNFATRDKKTIEFRIFRSNVSPRGFMKNLEFVAALVCWCRFASPFEISMNPQDVRMDEGTRNHRGPRKPGYQNFITWVAAHRYDYPMLARWLEQGQYIPPCNKPLPGAAAIETL